MGSCHLLHLPLGECIRTFNLEDAVCNHGFFMIAPNSWIPSTKTLQRPLRLANSATSVMVSISHPPNNSSILIQVHDIQNKQVGRMLRISEGVQSYVREFQNMHLEAKKKGECITTFNLEDAVSNHGFFMMAPNSWIPSTKTLQRPLRLAKLHHLCHGFYLTASKQ
ncbi:hypothetical protein CFP56_000743 [Quercus suber]|uniref:Uncharacterized protein n=1 Tax=Quercus suber TaxID=58331 RepID=A0AAW0IP71_QUESU